MASSEGRGGKAPGSKIRSISGGKYASRLSGGSFKGRFASASHHFKDRNAFGDRTSGGSSSSLSSTSSSAISGPISGAGTGSSAGSSRSSLNRIASSASNFQTYASRYIESIRPKSWGNKTGTGTGSGNSLAAPQHLGLSRSAESSRSSAVADISAAQAHRRPQLGQDDLGGRQRCRGRHGRDRHFCRLSSPVRSWVKRNMMT